MMDAAVDPTVLLNECFSFDFNKRDLLHGDSIVQPVQRFQMPGRWLVPTTAADEALCVRRMSCQPDRWHHLQRLVRRPVTGTG